MKTGAITTQAIELEKKVGSLNYAPLPVVLARGEGAYLWDVEGKRYLDFVSGYSAVSQGHCHPRIVKALQDQAARLTLVSRALYSDQLGPFSEYATKLFGYDRILMMNTGAEAFETACKLARKWGYTKKKIPEGQAKVIVCNENFHGRTLGAVSASSNAAHHKVFGPVMPGFVHIPFDDLPALAEALKDPTVCAMIVEPIQGEAGIRVPQEGYLKSAAGRCRASDVLFIADEIQTGIARTGKILASHHEGVKPDAVLLGKSLSGATLPVSAVLADTALMEMLQPGDHGSTFGGSPLACAVAHEALKVVVEEKLTERAQTLGEIFRSAVRDLGSPLIKEVRGKGLLNAVVFNWGDEDKEIGNRFSESLLQLGMLAKPTRPTIVRFAPPLVISEKDLLEGVKIFGQALSDFALTLSAPRAE